MGHPDVEVGGRRERLDAAHGTRAAPQGRCGGQSARDGVTSDGKTEKGRGAMTKKPRDLDPLETARNQER